MRPLAKSAVRRVVLPRQVWRRRDPSGAWQTFDVITANGLNMYAQKCAKGKTASGRVITLNLAAMESGDERFELLHERYVDRTG